MASGTIKKQTLKSVAFSGTTDSAGNFAILPLSVGVVVGVRETHNYMPIVLVTSGNTNYVKFIDSSATTFQAKTNTAVNGEVYYLEV